MARFSREDEDDDDDRPRRGKKKPRDREGNEEDEFEERVPRSKRRPLASDSDDTPAKSSRRRPSTEEDDSDEEAPKKKKKSKKKKPPPGAAIIQYAIYASGVIGVLLVGLILYYLVTVFYVKPAATIEGIDWYKADNTLKRFDFLFPGGRPSYDLIRLRNPQTDVSVRAELWQRRYKGRMYEACYFSGEKVSAANVNGAAMGMKDAPPPDSRAVSWHSKIVLNDGARTIVMRVYGPEQIAEDDPLVVAFFENFKLN
jgi:hypothetical protein